MEGYCINKSFKLLKSSFSKTQYWRYLELGQTLYEMKKIIYEKLTAGIFDWIKQWKEEREGHNRTKFILEASCEGA